MRLLEFFGLSVLTIILLVALSYVPLLGDIITNSGYSSSEVFGGIGAVAIMFYAFIMAATGGKQTKDETATLGLFAILVLVMALIAEFPAPAPPPSVPFGIDGTAANGVHLGTSIGAALTTGNDSDLIVVFISIGGTGGANSTVTVTDADSMTWHLRASDSGTSPPQTEWYAVASGTLASDTITAHSSVSANIQILAFGVSDANSAPFDTDASLPSYQTGSGSTPSGTVSTSNANDMILGFLNSGSSPTITAGSGYTLISTDYGSAPTGAGEYEIVSSTVSSKAVDFSLSLSPGWNVIGDAVRKA